jgi:hypothetical protein
MVGGLYNSAAAQQLSNSTNKPEPQVEAFRLCPPEGTLSKRADPELNRKKNRIDSSAKFHPTELTYLRRLTYPAEVSKKRRTEWQIDQSREVSRFEGTPIATQGYLLLTDVHHQLYGARPSSGESCNCWKTDDRNVDYVLWLAGNPLDNKANSVVVVVTPRIRIRHSQWTINNFTYIATRHYPVRIYGWLLLNQEHPEQLGKQRATLWEIHPIVQIQFKEHGTWKTL